jgi:hypothetical protein
VRIKGQGIRLLNSFDERVVARSDFDECADAPVDMQPKSVSPADVLDRSHIVDRPSIHRSSCRDHADRADACSEILFDRLLERWNIYAEVVIRRHQSQGVAAETEQLHRFLVAAMNLIGSVETQRFG